MDKATKWGLVLTMIGLIIGGLSLFRDVYDFQITLTKKNNKEINNKSLPKDVLEMLIPGVNIDFVIEKLGHPRWKNTSNDSSYNTLIYEFDETEIRLLVKNNEIKSSCLLIKEFKDGISYSMPRFKFDDGGFSFEIGTATWKDVATAENDVLFDDSSARWFRAYVDVFYGQSGGYLNYIYGSSKIKFKFTPKHFTGNDQVLENEPIIIENPEKHKINYVIVSSFNSKELLSIDDTFIPAD